MSNKPYILILTLIALLIGCTEGDIIELELNFEATPEDCFNTNNFVIYKIDADTNSAISLTFTSTSFEVNQVPAQNADGTFPDQTITLNGQSNVLTYRTFDKSINGETYFCSSVPPANILVTEEFNSRNGVVTISYMQDPANEKIFTRTVTLSNITFSGDDMEIRREFYDFGSYQITIP